MDFVSWLRDLYNELRLMLSVTRHRFIKIHCEDFLYVIAYSFINRIMQTLFFYSGSRQVKSTQTDLTQEKVEELVSRSNTELEVWFFVVSYVKILTSFKIHSYYWKINLTIFGQVYHKIRRHNRDGNPSNFGVWFEFLQKSV